MASTMLKRAGLKAYSGPFDWIFSSFDMVRDCIETDFADFLNIDFMTGVPAERRQAPSLNFCDHILYKQHFGLDSIFNHYDPRDPERYQYLRRCVRRFRAVMASGDAHLLLAIGRFKPAEEAAFDRLCSLLEGEYPAMDAQMIRLGPIGSPAPSFTVVRRGLNPIFKFAPVSADDGVNFADDRDNDALAAALHRTITLSDPAAVSQP